MLTEQAQATMLSVSRVSMLTNLRLWHHGRLCKEAHIMAPPAGPTRQRHCGSMCTAGRRDVLSAGGLLFTGSLLEVEVRSCYCVVPLTVRRARLIACSQHKNCVASSGYHLHRSACPNGCPLYVQ